MKIERQELSNAVADQKSGLEKIQKDVKVLQDVRHWINQVLPPEQRRETAEPGKKPSISQ